MSNYQRVESWLRACGKQPDDQGLSIQIGCHIEEFVEFLGCVDVAFGNDTKESCILALTELAKSLKVGGINRAVIPAGQRADALDALCDSEVTGNGVAFFARFNKEEADRRVLDANDAKLVDGKPVILPGGKIGKPDGWKPPHLTDCI